MIDTTTPPPGSNPLAAELRQIERDLLDPDRLLAVTLERLRRLVEHVERLGTEPVTAEFDAVASGLDPEEERRIAAGQLANGTPRSDARQMLIAAGHPAGEEGVIDATVLDLADIWAAYIRTGARPAPAGCGESREDVERVHDGNCLMCDRPAVEHPPETP